MEFFVVLLFLLAVRYWWGELPRLGRGLLPRWLGVVKAQLNGVPFYLVAVILPAFCVGYLAEALEAEVSGLLTLMIHIAVLIIAVQAPSTEQLFDELLIVVRQKQTEGVTLAADQKTQIKNLLVCLHHDFLGYLLWYLLLGPGGVMFLALQKQFEGQEINNGNGEQDFNSSYYARLSPWLVGLGVRLSLLLLAIVGTFREGWPLFLKSLKDWTITDADLLVAGFDLLLPDVAALDGAFRVEEHITWLDEYEALIGRLFFAWAGLAALIVVVS